MATPATYSGSMTARQFNEAVKQVHVTDTQRSRARRVLVDGKSVREVAQADRVTVHVIYRAVRSVAAGNRTNVGYWPGISPMSK